MVYSLGTGHPALSYGQCCPSAKEAIRHVFMLKCFVNKYHSDSVMD